MVDKVFWPVVRWMLGFFLVVVRLLLRCSRLLLCMLTGCLVVFRVFWVVARMLWLVARWMLGHFGWLLGCCKYFHGGCWHVIVGY